MQTGFFNGMASKLPEGHNPFSVYDSKSFDYIDKRVSSTALNLSKSILTSNPIVRSESLVDGPLTALIMAGMWKFLYAVQQEMLALFINDAVNTAATAHDLLQFTADFSCVAYSTAVSKALHNDEKKARGAMIGALWNKIWRGDSFVDSITNNRRKIFELIPPMTTSIMHVFILNLKLVRDSLSDNECEALLRRFDFSSFSKLNTPFEERLVFLGDKTLPDVLTRRRTALQSHLSYLENLACGKFFVGLMDHYDKKSDYVPREYLYGQFQ